MKLTEQEIKEIYRRGTARPTRREECLTEDQLARLARGEAAEQERIGAARHLMSCSDCAEEFRIARSTRSWAETIDDELEPAQPASQPSLRRRVAAMFSMPRLSYALAATSLIITLSLIAWIVSLQRDTDQIQAKLDQQASELDRAKEASRSLDQARKELEQAARQSDEYQSQLDNLKRKNDELSRTIEEMTEPQPNAFIADIEPGDSARGEDQKPVRTIEVPSYAGAITLNLSLTEQPSYSSYAMDIFNRSGSLIRRMQGLRISPDNTITVSLPARLIPDGQYRIKLYGSGKGPRKLVEDYRVRIRRR